MSSEWELFYSGATAQTMSYDGEIMYYGLNNGDVYSSTDPENPIVTIPDSYATAMASSGGAEVVVLLPVTGPIYVNFEPVAGSPEINWACCACSSDGTNIVACGMNDESTFLVYLSTDGGGTFTQFITGLPVSSVSINDTDIFYVTEQAVLKGDLEDTTPSPFTGLPTKIWTTINNVQGNYLYVISSEEDTGVYISSSLSTSAVWTESVAFLPEGYSLQSVYCVPNQPQYVVVTSLNDQLTGNIYRSTNNGTTFTQVETTRQWENCLIGGETGLILYATAYVTGVPTIYLSTDGGVSCILEGMDILLSNGDTKQIQDIVVGDCVWTSSGSRVVKFVGSGVFDTEKEKHKQIMCLPAGAISEGCPTKDLLLTQGHALFFPRDGGDRGDDDNNLTPFDITYSSAYYDRSTTSEEIVPGSEAMTTAAFLEYIGAQQYYNSAFSPDPAMYRLLMHHCIMSIVPTVEQLHELPNVYYHIAVEDDNPEACYIINVNGVLCETMSIGYVPVSGLRVPAIAPI